MARTRGHVWQRRQEPPSSCGRVTCESRQHAVPQTDAVHEHGQSFTTRSPAAYRRRTSTKGPQEGEERGRTCGAGSGTAATRSNAKGTARAIPGRHKESQQDHFGVPDEAGTRVEVAVTRTLAHLARSVTLCWLRAAQSTSQWWRSYPGPSDSRGQRNWVGTV